MIPFIAVGFLIGGLLGLQFTVMAIVPVALGAGLIAAATIKLQGITLGSIVIELTYFLVFLQIGYFSGAGIRWQLRARVFAASAAAHSRQGEALRKPTPTHQ
jgi:hypothetical protein